MPLDVEDSLCLRFRNQRCEKDNRRSLQFWVGLDLCRYFASVSLWHHHVEQDQIGPEIPCTLIGLGSVVFFQHKIAAYLFEKDFDQVSAIPVVINNQDAPFFFHRRPPTLKFRVQASLRRCPIGKYPRTISLNATVNPLARILMFPQAVAGTTVRTITSSLRDG